MNFSDSTYEDCNVTQLNITYNISKSEGFMDTCLDLKCVPVSVCKSYIEKHVTPVPLEWIIIVIYSIIFLVGLTGNGLVCFVVIRTSHMRTIVNIFIVNLAVADFLVLLICLPPSILADTTESWYLGDFMCKLVPFLQVGYNI